MPIRLDTTMPNRNENEQEQAICQCGRSFKNIKGLNIHKGRMKCAQSGRQLRLTQQGEIVREEIPVDPRTELSGETIENISRDANHSAEVLEVTQDFIEATPTTRLHTTRQEPRASEIPDRKPRVKWPTSREKKKWSAFEEDMEKILENTLNGSAEGKIRVMTTLVYNMGAERFGLEEKKADTVTAKGGPSRRQKQISKLRKHLKSLKKRWLQAEEDDDKEKKQGLADLRKDVRKQLKSLRRAEAYARKRKLKEKNRNRFLKNPYGFTSRTLGVPRSGTLQCNKEDLEDHLATTHSNPQRDEPLEIPEGLELPNRPEQEFDEGDIR